MNIRNRRRHDEHWSAHQLSDIEGASALTVVGVIAAIALAAVIIGLCIP